MKYGTLPRKPIYIGKPSFWQSSFFYLLPLKGREKQGLAYCPAQDSFMKLFYPPSFLTKKKTQFIEFRIRTFSHQSISLRERYVLYRGFSFNVSFLSCFIFYRPVHWNQNHHSKNGLPHPLPKEFTELNITTILFSSCCMLLSSSFRSALLLFIALSDLFLHFRNCPFSSQFLYLMCLCYWCCWLWSSRGGV